MSHYNDLNNPDFAADYEAEQRVIMQQKRIADYLRWKARGCPEKVYKHEKKIITMGDLREMKEWYDSQDPTFIEGIREGKIDESVVGNIKDLKEARFAIEEVERWEEEQAEAYIRHLYHYDNEDD